MKKIKTIILVTLFALSVLLPVVGVSSDVAAQNALETACQSDPGSAICQNNEGQDVGTIIRTVVNILLFIVGAIAVIMLIIGGIRYTTSGGDSSGVTAAKNTILYAIVGLVVAFLAFAIVNWVLQAL